MAETPLERLLEEIRSAAAELHRGGGCPSPYLAPIVLLDAGLLALTYNPLLDAVAAASSLALLAARGGLARLRLIAYPVALSAVAAIPLIPLGRVADAVSLVARTVTPALLLLAAVAWMGWRGLLASLSALGAPRLIVEGLEMLLYQGVKTATMMLEVIAARRARHLGRVSWRDWWRLQATALGDMMLRAVREAEQVYMAVKARTLGDPAPRRGSAQCNTRSLAPLAAATLAVAALGVVAAAARG